MNIAHPDIILDVPHEFIIFISGVQTRSPFAIGVRIALTNSSAERCATTSIVLLTASVVTGRAVDLQEASDEGFQEGGTSCDDANIQLKTSYTQHVSMIPKRHSRRRGCPAIGMEGGRARLLFFFLRYLSQLTFPTNGPNSRMWYLGCHQS